MTFLPGLPQLQFDEIGLATARHGDYLLKSAFQLVFRREGSLLRAAMVTGHLRRYLRGNEVPLETYEAALEQGSRSAHALSCTMLHASNHENCGVDGLIHLLSPQVPADQATVRGIEHVIAETGFEPSELMFTLNVDAPASPPVDGSDTQIALASRLRALGVGIALQLPAATKFDPHTLGAIKPDLLRLDAGGLAMVLQDAGARRLFASQIDQLHRDGISVLMEGVDTTELLDLALSVNVSLLCGDALACAQLAGTIPPPVEITLPKDGATSDLIHQHR